MLPKSKNKLHSLSFIPSTGLSVQVQWVWSQPVTAPLMRRRQKYKIIPKYKIRMAEKNLPKMWATRAVYIFGKILLTV